MSDNSVVFEDAETVRVGGGGGLPQRIEARSAIRVAVLAAIALLVAGCGGDKPAVAAGPTLSDEEVKQKCADQQWRDQNLGLWYAVCRKPVAW